MAKPYKFGDGIRELAKLDPEKLAKMTADMTIEENKPGALMADVVLREIEAAESEE